MQTQVLVYLYVFNTSAAWYGKSSGVNVRLVLRLTTLSTAQFVLSSELNVNILVIIQVEILWLVTPCNVAVGYQDSEDLVSLLLSP